MRAYRIQQQQHTHSHTRARIAIEDEPKKQLFCCTFFTCFSVDSINRYDGFFVAVVVP